MLELMMGTKKANGPTGTWESVGAITPVGRYRHASCIIGDKLYISGGVSGSTLKDFWQYDTITKVWTPLTDIPVIRANHFLANVGGVIYVFGGSNNQNVLVASYRFNTNAWTPDSAVAPEAKRAAAGCVIDNVLYLINGENSGTGTLFATTLTYNTLTGVWLSKTSTGQPAGTTFSTATVVSGKIYLHGGSISTSVIGNMWVYTPGTDSWETKTSSPIPRSSHSAAVIDDTIYYFGGTTTAGAYNNDIWSYNTTTDKWTKMNAGATSRNYPTLDAVNGDLYLVAGAIPPTLSTFYNDMWKFTL